MILLLFLLVFSWAGTRAEAVWKCPEMREERRGGEIACHCEIAHTLRSVEGDFEAGTETEIGVITGVTASYSQALMGQSS